MNICQKLIVLTTWFSLSIRHQWVYLKILHAYGPIFDWLVVFVCVSVRDQGNSLLYFFSFVSQSIVLFVGTSNEFELRTGSVCNDCTCYSFVICVILQFKIFSILIEKKTNNDRLCFQWNVPFIYFYVFYFSLAIYGYTRSGKYDWHSQNKYLIANV